MSAAVAARSSSELGVTLDVERTEIVFHNETPDRVRVEITVRNLGEELSAPTFAVLQAAPLGAFVPWRPLTILPVPGLLPGEAATLETTARVPQVAPLGPPNRVPPSRLLTALGLEDDGRPGLDRAETLPADPFQLLGQGQRHWAGNFNVFIDGKATERHLAQALRIYPGLVNMAMFVVGSTRDAYRFELRGTGADWEAVLCDMMELPALASDGRDARVPLGEWVPVRSRRILMLALRPPLDATAGTVDVHVTQRSTGQEAVVEFSLDPNAAGAGCFTL